MSWMRKTYGGRSEREAMNRAIAGECAGGRLVLMRIEDVHHIRQRRLSSDPGDPWTTVAHWLEAIRNDMEDYIRAKHDRQPRKETHP